MRDKRHGLGRSLLAEFLGTALLLTAVVGSGIAAQRLSPGNVGLELLENSTATGAALVTIIFALGPVSGAHLNPLVTMAGWLTGSVPFRAALAYCGSQVVGSAAGTMVANVMFELPVLQVATKPRLGTHLWAGEVVATFGLLLVIFGLTRSGRSSAVAPAVGAYIAAAYWFTSSTSFANPAVTLARTLSDTFAGISPASVPAFLAAQLAGGMLAMAAIRLLYPSRAAELPAVQPEIEVTS